MPALPPGFLVNSTGIEGSIDRIDNEPLDQADIAKLWKVYTITQRRLLDPTAERLENLWWRIWGSRKKQLKGAVVARLFAQISDGQSFVPLRGPSSVVEGTPTANTSIRHGPGASSTTALHRQNQSRPSTTSSSTASKAPVPMPHPILKKTRGPSTTGPRPTARFISPHESQDDSDQSSSVSPNAHVVVQPPSGPPSPSTNSREPKSDKKSSIKKKAGFVASAGKKRRPMIVRRQSSQTSQSSTESPARNYDVAQAGMSTQSSSERTPPSFAEQSRKSQSRFQENFSPASDRSATTKKPMRKRESLQSSDAKSLSPRKFSREGRINMMQEQEVAVTGDPGPSRQPRQIENNQQLIQSPTAGEFDEVEVQRALLEEANARLERKIAATETSNQEARQPRAFQRALRSKSEGKLTSKGKSVACLAPTLTAASGQMNLGDTDSSDAPPKSRSSSASLAKGKGRDPGDMRRPEMFTKRPVPAVLSAAAPDATDKLSRSKSQLTLLLERDRARSGEKKVEKGKGKGTPKGGA